MILLLWLACGAEAPVVGEAARYAEALDPEVPLERALESCAALEGPDARGDCATAALEARGRLAVDDCQRVSEGRWREECWFLLAERTAAAGAVEAAVSLCQRTRFARECSFHLLRSVAQAAETPADLEAALSSFQGAWPVPDAGTLAWQEWLRARQAEGQPVDGARCEGLTDVRSCREAVKRLWRAAAAALRPDTLCAALDEGRAPLTLKGGAPAFVLDEGMRAEARGRCPAGP